MRCIFCYERQLYTRNALESPVEYLDEDLQKQCHRYSAWRKLSYIFVCTSAISQVYQVQHGPCSHQQVMLNLDYPQWPGPRR